ncbi:MAG: hypothetical protein PHX87_00900 [Candidatus Peribacteraceae bacterium]|nr:hypothetical protein [Candidatus Peribacteraceae bacterium]MDD5741967.1 hypothetical protein [Candidatus Peribacteraceae bacterium]
MEQLHHECAVIGVTGREDAVQVAARIAQELDHRGGCASGLTVAHNGAFKTVKENGHAAEVLTPRRLTGLRAASAIAHDRYATAGPEDPSLAQPEVHRSRVPGERFAFGWNGTLANAEDLRNDERERGTILRTTGDTELLKLQMLRGIQQHTVHDLAAVFGEVEARVDGAFNVVMLLPDGTLAAYRDKQGRHPLNCTEDGIVASEDTAIRAVVPSAHVIPVKPGELFVAGRDGVQHIQVMPPDPRRCFFEWEYFSDWQSNFDDRSVGTARQASGRILALLDTLSPEGSIVVPVPDSARKGAEAFAHQKGWPFIGEGIENLLPGQRTFTATDPERTEKARRKYGIHRAVLQGKSIVLVDDSLVRGTTMRELIRRLRSEGGVAQIHLRLASPPILSPCFYGIDFPEIRELIVRHNFNGTLRSGTLPPEVLRIIAARLGVDSIQFLPVEAIPLAIGCEIKSLCMACVTGQYPTPCGQRRADSAEGRILPVLGS